MTLKPTSTDARVEVSERFPIAREEDIERFVDAGMALA
jgi:hypothetical protein